VIIAASKERAMSLRSTLFVSFLTCATLMPHVGYSAEIKILSANVFTGVLDGLINDFERSSGHKVIIIYATAGNIRNRVQSDEFGDVTIVTRPMMDELEKNGKVVRGTSVNIARSAVAVVVRSGAPKPNISSIDALKRSLLAAKSVSYPDPTRGGATGVLFTGILERLGLTAEIKPKTKFPPPGHFAVELVSKGEAEIAIAQPMEALLQSGVEIVGLLPSELQDRPNFTFTVAQMTVAKEPNAARSLIQHLVGPVVQSALKNKGMEPGIEK
jgi:molybdate transport system substrate-binding protein